MAYSFPLSLAALYDLLNITSVKFDEARFDEHSGIGSGHDWQAELAGMKWTAEITVAVGSHDSIKQIAARIRKLKGSQNAFYICDPVSPYPQYDPTGSILGSSTVQVAALDGGGQALSLKGLPASFRITIGDKGQVADASGNYFFEFSETVTASGGGTTAQIEVYPPPPVWLAVNDTVILKKPACKMIRLPGSFDPGTADAKVGLTDGLRFKAIERK